MKSLKKQGNNAHVLSLTLCLGLGCLGLGIQTSSQAEAAQVLLASARTGEQDLATDSASQIQAPLKTPAPSADPKTLESAPPSNPALSIPKPTRESANFSQDSEADQQSEQKSVESYGKSRGLLGPVTVGLSAALALPRPIVFGLEGKYGTRFGGAFNYGFLPNHTFSSIAIKYNAWDVRGRWFPWDRAFFLGLAFGRQTLTGSTTKSISGFNVLVTAQLKTLFLTPHVGWNWEWHSGFFLGMDLGVQLPMDIQTTVSSDVTDPSVLGSSLYTDAKNQVTDQANKFGKIPLPMITLLRIGYRF